MRRPRLRRSLPLVAALLLLLAAAQAEPEPQLSDERVVFQTAWGDVEWALLPSVAPVTAQHIFALAAQGAYQGNHIFRVDKGFVAQVAAVVGGRTAALNPEQKAKADRTVPLEVRADVKHVEGVLSMGRYDDPNSGTSSFSFLLGAAPHLDGQYTIFGRVTQGLDVLHKLEGLETRREGIFVMPKERVTILATYWYLKSRPFVLGGFAKEANPGGTTGLGSSYCDHLQDELDKLRKELEWTKEELHRVRHKCLPGT